MAKRPRNSYSETIRAVGSVNLEWADLEHNLAQFIVNLTCVWMPVYDQDANLYPLIVLLTHLDVRERIQTIKVLAHHVVEDDFYKDLEGVLNRIDNELRVERNRFVHDRWDFPNNGIVRIQQSAKVYRTQAFQRESRLDTETYFDLKSVWRLYHAIGAARDELERLNNRLSEIKRPQEP